ncbi:MULTISPECIES: DUF4347 domain-containing protein [Spirulina sp. CCY15215]|uniref:DUF4347 domain-containing protein n=1 Tax=Spirulina sp. CCY15215 TaxID=2767591 RepID=UPI0019526A44|nr:DUF4347 domain-containing protein [Spirulina major]
MISLGYAQTQSLPNPRPENPSFSALQRQGVLIAIDAHVAHVDRLVEGAIAGAEILILDSQRDGIAQITNALRSRHHVTQLHIISHGAAGRLYVGNTQLSLENLADYASSLQQWQSITNTPSPLEILLYGCQIAKGVQGREFIEQLSRLTGANITASTTLTGNAALQGNWQLDYKTGKNNTPLALTAEIMADYPDIFIDVNNVAELITAINDANSNPDLTTINLVGTTFNIASPDSNRNDFGATGLPIITTEIVINGGGKTIGRSGSENLRFFVVDTTGNLTLNNLTLQNGRVTNTSQSLGDDGGAILNLGGTVAINDSIITGNFAADDGGAIANIGVRAISGDDGIARLTINNTTISNNNAVGDSGLNDGGGGIENDGNIRSGGGGANITITNSFVTGNTSTNGTGGGIRNRDGGILSVTDTFVENNITNNSHPFGKDIFMGNEQPNPLLNEAGTTNTLVRGSAHSLGMATNADFDFDSDMSFVDGGFIFSPDGGSPNFIPPAPIPLNFTRTSITPLNNIIIKTTNIPGLTGLFPSLLEFTQDNKTPEMLLDNTLKKTIDLGVFNLGSGTFATTFKLANIGASASQNLQLKDFNIAPLFTVTPSSLSTDTISLDFGTSTTFDIKFDPATSGTQSGTIGFNILKVNTNVVTPFEFVINTTVVDPTPTPTPTPTPVSTNNLNVDSGNIFTVGSNGGSNLKVTLTEADINSISNLKLLRLSDSNQTISTFNLFSALPDGFHPGGFSVALQTSISGTFQAGDRFAIELENFEGGTTGFSPQQLSVRDERNGLFELGFANGLTVEIQQTTANIPLGVGTQQTPDLEVLDLLSVGGIIQANFKIFREARFSNVVGLYKIDDTNGTVGGIAPGQSGYAKAAIENRVRGVNLSVSNQQQSSANAALNGGSLYAPFIIVDATPEQFLLENSQNSSNGVQAYFLFGAANSDRFDHILLLGNNTFGFEDLPNGGDRDYNDLIFSVDLVA